MTTYVFTTPDHTSAQRTADDGSVCAIPWSTDPVQPLDVDGLWGRTWVEDGSPIPEPYRAPPNPALDDKPAKTANQILGVT